MGGLSGFTEGRRGSYTAIQEGIGRSCGECHWRLVEDVLGIHVEVVLGIVVEDVLGIHVEVAGTVDGVLGWKLAVPVDIDVDSAQR